MSPSLRTVIDNTYLSDEMRDTRLPPSPNELRQPIEGAYGWALVDGRAPAPHWVGKAQAASDFELGHAITGPAAPSKTVPSLSSSNPLGWGSLSGGQTWELSETLRFSSGGFSQHVPTPTRGLELRDINDATH
jgi:hypothetical protein